MNVKPIEDDHIYESTPEKKLFDEKVRIMIEREAYRFKIQLVISAKKTFSEQSKKNTCSKNE